MGFQVVSDEFVQIVHDGFGHWLTITNIGASQIAAWLKTTESEIRIK